MLGCNSWRENPLPSQKPPVLVQTASLSIAQRRGDGSLDSWPGPLEPMDSAGPPGPALRRIQGVAAPPERAPRAPSPWASLAA